MKDILSEQTIQAPCEICGKSTLPLHHKFRQGKNNREEFGPLLDLPFNRQFICAWCNTSHDGQKSGKLVIWNRFEFIRALIKYLKENTNIFEV